MDVYNLYMNADLEELMYMRQPLGYIEKSSQHVLKLKKTMYRLKQSGQVWYRCLSSAMDKIGFMKLRSDGAVFYRHSENGFAIIAMAIDNLTITAINDNIIHEIKADLKRSSRWRILVSYTGF